MIKVPTRENLLDVWSSSGGEVFVSGIRTLLHSRDYGKSWVALLSTSQESPRSFEISTS